MHSQSEVIVGAEHNASFAFHNDLYILLRLELVKVRVDAHLLDVFDQMEILAFFE